MELPVISINGENGMNRLISLRAKFPREKVQYRALSMPGSFKKPTKLEEIGYRNQPKSDPMWSKVKGVKAIAPVAFYVDARDIEDRLDRTVGPHNWDTKAEVFADGALVHLGIFIDGRMVWKCDGSERTTIEGFKGAISKAMVRVASSWGIGRYFYDLKLNFPVHNPSGDGKGWYFDNKYDGKNWVEPQSIIPDEFLP